MKYSLCLALSGLAIVLVAAPVHAGDAASPAAEASVKPLEFSKRVIAKVNGVPITVAQVDKAVSNYIPQAVFHQSVSDEKLIMYRQRALQTLIYEQLLYNEAERRELKVEDKTIDKKVEEMTGQYGGETRFLEVLRDNNYTLPEYRNVIRRNVLVERVQEAGPGEFPVVSDSDVEKYYNDNVDRFVEPEKVKVSHILIKIDPSSSKEKFEERVKLAEMLLEKARRGDDFADLAREFSDDSSKESGGDLGTIHKGRLEPAFEDAAFSMEVGEVRGLVRTLYGFHILKLEGKIASRHVPYEEMRERLKKDLQEEAQDKARREWLQGLWDRAEIEFFDVTQN